MSGDNQYNEYLFKMSSVMRRELIEIQKKVREVYNMEGMEDYIEIKDNPIEHALAALSPLIGQVNDFHDYAETVTDRMALDLDEVNIYDLLDGVMTIADQLVESKPKLRLEEDIEDDLPNIKGDATRIS